MKASDFIKELQILIEQHGDLELALTEYDEMWEEVNYVSIDSPEVFLLKEGDKYFDENDVLQEDVSKVFLID